MLSILATIGLFMNIIELGYETDKTIDQWKLHKVLPIVSGLILFELCINAVFFIWTSIVIYQVLFDVQPTTYNQVVQLLVICFINMIIDYFALKR